MRLRPSPDSEKFCIRWGVLLGVLLGAIWSFLWFVVPGAAGQSHGAGGSARRRILREVRTALRDYAAAQNGGYPRQLEALGEQVRTAAQFAQSVNYQLQYTPGPVEADGLIHTYVLQARAGNYGFRNFYTDDSGISARHT